MKLGVVGGRNLRISAAGLDSVVSDAARRAGQAIECIVTGDCPTGVDADARRYAAARGIVCRVYRADWMAYGKSAGPRRNKELVEDCDILVAVWDGESRGTASAISLATKAGKPVRIVPAGSMRCL